MAEESKTARIEKMIASLRKAVRGDQAICLDLTNKNDELDILAGEINTLTEAWRECCASSKRMEELLHAKPLFPTDIFEKHPYAMWVADASGTSIGFNQAYSSLMDLREEDVKGKYNILQDNIFQEQGFLPLIQSVFQAGETIQFTLKYDTSRRKSSKQSQPQTIFLEITAFPLLDENGTSKNVVFIYHDITARTLAEKDLYLTQFCVDHAGVGIFRIEEPDARIVSVNEQACRNLGYTKEELCNMTVLDIDPNFNLQTWREHRKKIRDLSSGTIETQHRRKDGSIFPVEVTITYFKYLGKELSFSFVQDITERKKAEVSLRESEQKYRNVVDNLGIAITLISPDMEILSVNRLTRERFPSVDFTKRPICFKTFNNPPREQPCSYCATTKTLSDGKVHETITETPTISGIRNYKITTSPFKDDAGNVTAVIEITEDITEKLRIEQEKEKLERQLLLAQKMEAVGTLAGGIAHDFNNMLSVIIGYAGLIKRKLSSTDPLLQDVSEIENAALRSRDTTRQLLAFSRQQAIAPKPINLGSHIKQLQKTLARLIGEDIELLVQTAKDLWLVEFDPAQIDQILINLAVNARDAMPQGGKLTIGAENIILNEQYCQAHPEAMPGSYVLLQVNDEGVGMEAEVLSHLFEPFFTTKEIGQGTGLGLATVYGIIQQNKGLINVVSEPGRGSTFKIYIPKRQAEEETDDQRKNAQVDTGTETILLVEDDKMVRHVLTRILESLGYAVLVAETPMMALSICAGLERSIDLLLTDVVMPEMNGAELRDRIIAIRPAIKVVFMSGYTPNVIGRHGVLEKGVHFIQKPVTQHDLAQKIREALSNDFS